MADTETTAPAEGQSRFEVMNVPADGPEKLSSVTEAARLLQSMRRPKETSAEPSPDEGDVPAAPEITPEVNDAAPIQEPPVETEATETEPEVPAIDPPRSWTAEAKEAFTALPHEHQQAIADRERAREVEFRRGQDEVAEQRKAIQAQVEAAAQAKQNYEAATQALLADLQQQRSGEFADIKTWDDVSRLSVEDPFRFTKWQAHQMKVNAVQAEAQLAQQRQSQEQQTQWASFATKEDALLAQADPEIADPAKRARLQESVVATLTKMGFTQDELAKYWNGQEKLPMRDHRIQKLVLDGVRWQNAQAKKVITATKKPVPQVQRPGTATSRDTGREFELKTLEQKLDAKSSLKAAADLLIARRAARR